MDDSAASASLIIFDSQFEYISARTIGGAIYVLGGNTRKSIVIFNCVFNNIYAYQGSVIYAKFQNIKLKDVNPNVIFI